MKLQLMLVVASLVLIDICLASPRITSSSSTMLQTLSKRSQGGDRGDLHFHGVDCGCPSCYERKLQRPRIQLRRSGDYIKKPALQVLCEPIMKSVDIALSAVEKSANDGELEKYEKQHKKWLKKQAKENAAYASGGASTSTPASTIGTTSDQAQPLANQVTQSGEQTYEEEWDPYTPSLDNLSRRPRNQRHD